MLALSGKRTAEDLVGAPAARARVNACTMHVQWRSHKPKEAVDEDQRLGGVGLRGKQHAQQGGAE